MDREQTPELIEQQMHATRESLTDKVAALETQVMGTLQSATTAVQDTVESVKTAVSDTKATVQDTVKESIASVKGAFDVASHTRDNPWAMVGGAAVAGLVVGLLVFRKDRSLGMTAAAAPAYQPPVGSAPTYRPAATPPQPKEPGLFDELLARAGQEVRKLAEDALASCSAQIKQSLHDNVPKLLDTVGEKVTQKVASVMSTEPAAHNGRHLESAV